MGIQMKGLPEGVIKLMEKGDMWSYAQLSHNAKMAGGPNEFINKIATVSYMKGYLDCANDGLIKQLVNFVSIAK